VETTHIEEASEHVSNDALLRPLQQMHLVLLHPCTLCCVMYLRWRRYPRSHDDLRDLVHHLLQDAIARRKRGGARRGPARRRCEATLRKARRRYTHAVCPRSGARARASSQGSDAAAARARASRNKLADRREEAHTRGVRVQLWCKDDKRVCNA
jgi:hypothetical protein